MYYDSLLTIMSFLWVAFFDSVRSWLGVELGGSSYKIPRSLHITLCSVLPMIVSNGMCLLRFTATWSDRVELTQDRHVCGRNCCWLTFKEYS